MEHASPTTLRYLMLGLLLLTAATPLGAAGGEGSVDGDFLRHYAETYAFRLGLPAHIEPMPNGDGVLFLRSGPRSLVRDLYLFDPATGTERQLLTASQLLDGAEETLTAAEKARRERQRLTARGLVTFSLSRDGRTILAPLSGQLYLFDRTSGAVRQLDTGEGYALAPELSPDGGKVAYAVDGDLYVIDLATGTRRRLTHRQSETVSHGMAEFVAQEEMKRHQGFWWSPQGSHLAFQRTDTTGMEVFRIADPLDPSQPAQTWPYPRPGKKNAEVRLGIVPAAGGETVWVQWDRQRYPYLAAVTWTTNAPLTLLVQNRRQTEEALLAVDPASGTVETLLVERDEAWLNLATDMPHWLEDGSGFLWATERGGAWQLELRDRDGALRHTLNAPELGLRELVHLDDKAGAVYVLASAEPTESHLYRLPLDPATGSPVRLTSEAGVHEAVFAPDGRLRVITSRLRAGGRRYRVEDAMGGERGTLRSLAEQPSFKPQPRFLTAGTDPVCHAVLLRPRNFDPARRYPVILRVYGGPHSQVVKADADAYAFEQWIADHGFIVVSIDGRGTPSRGRAWERAIKHDFIALPLADQAAALQDLGARFPEMDLSRVGVYGWSFGGYFSAMAVMRRPDLFHAAVAGAPVADWHDYDTHYTERYLGLPDDDAAGYDASSVLTYAPDLERPLLIIHGTADDNVYFMHALKLSNALFRAGRDHDFLALAGFTHMVPDALVINRLFTRIMRYFETHLGAPAAP